MPRSRALRFFLFAAPLAALLAAWWLRPDPAPVEAHASSPESLADPMTSDSQEELLPDSTAEDVPPVPAQEAPSETPVSEAPESRGSPELIAPSAREFAGPVSNARRPRDLDAARRRSLERFKRRHLDAPRP